MIIILCFMMIHIQQMKTNNEEMQNRKINVLEEYI